MQPKNWISLSILLCLQLFAFSHANALRLEPDFIYGFMGGLGGSGINKTVEVEGIDIDVSRSEGPGIVGLSIETFIHDRWSMSLGHRRGFRLGPFSMDISFTGLTFRRYFYKPTPVLPRNGLGSAVSIQTWAPFVGFGSGVALGETDRDTKGEQIPNLDFSGVFFGFHTGVDYHWKPGIILRPEIFYSQTFMDSSLTAATISEFGLVLGVHFRL